MKRQHLALALALAACGAGYAQQTLWVTTGQVRYGFDASQVGQMPFNAAADTLTVQNKAFAVSDIDSLHIAGGLPEYNTVLVDYDGDAARVTVAGNIADRVTVAVDGAHVSVVQDSALVTEEIFYTLQGSSTDGSFYQDGNLKATVILNGLTLTSSRGAAIYIDDGKRIEVQLADGTVNTLADCAGGSHKGCMEVDGHTEFKGGGDLVLTGRTKHAFKGGEYVEFKKSFLGNVIVKSAVGDGLNTNQYVEMKSGTLLVESCGGDGVQVDKKSDDTKEQNGQFIMSGGTVRVLATGEDGKGLKIEDTATITGGTLEVTSDDHALHSKANLTISGGDVYAYSASGNGVNASGTLTVAGGNVVAYGASTSGYGLRGATKLYVNGGNVAAVGAMTSTPQTATANQPALTYKGVLTQGTNLALDAADGSNVLALTVTRAYAATRQHMLLLSAPAITAGSTYTLTSGATLNDDAEDWHDFYYGGDAVSQAGTTTLGTATAATPYAQIK